MAKIRAIGQSGSGGGECACILYKTGNTINLIDNTYLTISGNTVTFLKACEGYIQAGRGVSATVSGTATYTNLIHKTDSYTGDLYSFSASVGDTLTVSNSSSAYDWSLYIAGTPITPPVGSVSGISVYANTQTSASLTISTTDVIYARGGTQATNALLIPDLLIEDGHTYSLSWSTGGTTYTGTVTRNGTSLTITKNNTSSVLTVYMIHTNS